eukprot:8974497-Prorocentrum_lima.AAC.1
MPRMLAAAASDAVSRSVSHRSRFAHSGSERLRVPANTHAPASADATTTQLRGASDPRWFSGCGGPLSR